MAEGTGPTVMAWADGERERWWSRAAALDHGRERDDWVTAATGADRFGDLTPPQVAWLIAKGPEASARALLATPLLMRHRQRFDVGRVAVARFELDALPVALGEAAEEPDRLGLLMLPFRGPEAALLVSGWLRHLGSARQWARLWLGRHPETAARALAPVAAGRPGKARQNAEDALRWLASNGHGPVPASPARKAKAPRWTLPEIRSVGGGTMPAPDVARLVDALQRSRLAAPPEPAVGDPTLPVPLAVESSAAAQPLVEAAEPELEKLIVDSDPASLAEFGRALLDAWLTDDMPPAQSWVVPAQAHLGDDATMDRLAPLVRSWPARSRWQRAIEGLAVLATVGTDVALRHLLAIEEGMSGGPTNDRAMVYLTQAAAGRGLSVTQLADRLAVTHGLAAGVTIDYGPRAFTAVVDDHLALSVVDADGRRLARPPKPGVRDNADAYQKFVHLKKELRATAAAQIARLEADMLGRRLRPAGDLARVLLPHPILGSIARRLVWGEYAADGRLVRTLRIAEDGSFADGHDTTAAVDGAARLGVVHPADMSDELAGWGQILADYEILQPFAQVHRPVVTLSDEERAATGLAGFGSLATDRVVRLMNQGWEGNGFRTQSRVHTQLAHRLPGGLTLLVELDPGVAMYTQNTVDTQRITEIWVDDDWSDHWQVARRTPLGSADPAALSELLVTLRSG